MKTSMAILTFWATSLSSLAFATPTTPTTPTTPASPASPASTPVATSIADNIPLPVTVGVYARHSGGKIAYHYRVTNNSQQIITAVTIGRDNQNDVDPNNDVNELIGLPSGWSARLGIPSTSSNSPTGWRVSVIAPEDNVPHAIAWEAINDHSPKILPGQTNYKMFVSLDKPDISYLGGHALVTFTDGNPIDLTVPIDQLDITPPSVTVILRPDTLKSESGKFVAIKASFIIKDDYDRLPEIKLESITANEPLEAGDILDASFGLDDRYFKLRTESKFMNKRIYTVTYSVTDASGNQTIASAPVTVSASALDSTP